MKFQRWSIQIKSENLNLGTQGTRIQRTAQRIWNGQTCEGARRKPRPPALATAATSSGPAMSGPIGAWTMPVSIPKRPPHAIAERESMAVKKQTYCQRIESEKCWLGQKMCTRAHKSLQSVTKTSANASKTRKTEERLQGKCTGNSSQEGGGEISWQSVPGKDEMGWMKGKKKILRDFGQRRLRNDLRMFYVCFGVYFKTKWTKVQLGKKDKVYNPTSEVTSLP